MTLWRVEVQNVDMKRLSELTSGRPPRRGVTRHNKFPANHPISVSGPGPTDCAGDSITTLVGLLAGWPTSQRKGEHMTGDFVLGVLLGSLLGFLFAMLAQLFEPDTPCHSSHTDNVYKPDRRGVYEKERK